MYTYVPVTYPCIEACSSVSLTAGVQHISLHSPVGHQKVERGSHRYKGQGHTAGFLDIYTRSHVRHMTNKVSCETYKVMCED